MLEPSFFTFRGSYWAKVMTGHEHFFCEETKMNNVFDQVNKSSLSVGGGLSP